ncbi:MAG: iron-containing alcohol dehydrogenase [Spirochaeta sp.]|nr:iron-containing alcohol dehydrogenase [Spirochaeta sp.]
MIEDFDFFLPIKIIFGAGKFNQAGKEAAILGKKALVVTGRRSAEESGLLPRLTAQLDRQGMEWFLFNKVDPNPTDLIIDQGAAIARRENCDLVIGLGGGSSLDAAKSIAVAAKSGLPIWRHIASWENDYIAPEGALPIMAIETLAGTSSESDNLAVITRAKTNEKPGYASSFLFPKTAIIDPEVMVTVPPKITAITGFDIFCHSLEGYVSKASHPIAAILNEKAIEIVVNNLPKALNDGSDFEARAQLAFANILAGFSLSHSKATLLHAIEHPLSGHFNIPHAQGLAALFPKWLEFSWEGNPEKFKYLGKVFGLADSDNNKANLLKKSREFLKKIGLDVSLSELGVDLNNARRLIDDTFLYMAGGIKNNPVTAGKEEIFQLLKESL